MLIFYVLAIKMNECGERKFVSEGIFCLSTFHICTDCVSVYQEMFICWNFHPAETDTHRSILTDTKRRLKFKTLSIYCGEN